MHANVNLHIREKKTQLVPLKVAYRVRNVGSWIRAITLLLSAVHSMILTAKKRSACYAYHPLSLTSELELPVVMLLLLHFLKRVLMLSRLH